MGRYFGLRSQIFRIVGKLWLVGLVDCSLKVDCNGCLYKCLMTVCCNRYFVVDCTVKRPALKRTCSDKLIDICQMASIQLIEQAAWECKMSKGMTMGKTRMGVLPRTEIFVSRCPVL